MKMEGGQRRFNMIAAGATAVTVGVLAAIGLQGGGEGAPAKASSVERCSDFGRKTRILEVVGVPRSRYDAVVASAHDHTADIPGIAKPRGDFPIGKFVLKNTKTTEIKIDYKVPKSTLNSGEYTAQGATNYFETRVESHFGLRTSVGTYKAADAKNIATWNSGENNTKTEYLSAMEQHVSSDDVALIVEMGIASQVCTQVAVQGQ